MIHSGSQVQVGRAGVRKIDMWRPLRRGSGAACVEILCWGQRNQAIRDVRPMAGWRLADGVAGLQGQTQSGCAGLPRCRVTSGRRHAK
jgi:hypothetical protein